MLSREELQNLSWWSVPQDQLLATLSGNVKGITDNEAKKRQAIFGLNEIAKKKKRNIAFHFISYFFNPLVLLLIAVAVASYLMDNVFSAIIISVMVLVSVCMTFYQEYTAKDAADKLRKMIQNTATALRNGEFKEVPLRYLVPGDIIRLSAGDLVPADCRIINCKDFFVNQASLTGESLPVEKNEKPVASNASMTERTNVAFFGSNVISGSAEAVIVRTGQYTQFGELAVRLAQNAPETAFDKGIKEYSMLMVKFVVVLIFIIFVINAVLKNNIIEALLFALAVAVGLTPEMLPAMVTANLSKGANNMSKKGVIVKRLPSIQNLGAMDVLCTDKTGTLTEDKIRLVRHVDINGEEKESILHFAYLNSYYQTGLRNPLDIAVLTHDAVLGAEKVDEFSKVDEIPFDFVRRRMSVVVEDHLGIHLLLTKGAPESVLPACISVSYDGSPKKITESDRKKMKELYDQLSKEGYRVLALASKPMEVKAKVYAVQDEKDLTFEGFLAFLDPPKKTAVKSLQELMKRGIEIKILSGDNELVNKKIADEVGLQVKGIVLGSEINNMSDESLQVLVERTTIFARVSPVQKERIILALQRNKHVVGFMGDGINDSLALKTSDVGISVDSAVDVAKVSAHGVKLQFRQHVLCSRR
jgi:Mg2+-importing ATPase